VRGPRGPAASPPIAILSNTLHPSYQGQFTLNKSRLQIIQQTHPFVHSLYELPSKQTTWCSHTATNPTTQCFRHQQGNQRHIAWQPLSYYCPRSALDFSIFRASEDSLCLGLAYRQGNCPRQGNRSYRRHLGRQDSAQIEEQTRAWNKENRLPMKKKHLPGIVPSRACHGVMVLILWHELVLEV